MLATTAGVALANATWGSIKLGQLAGGLGTGLLVILAALLARRGVDIAAGTVSVASAVLAGLILLGGIYNELPLVSTAFLVACPFTCLVARVPLLGLLGRRRKLLLAVAISGLFAAAAVLSAWLLLPEPSGYEGYY
jgi:hypothetical protein